MCQLSIAFSALLILQPPRLAAALFLLGFALESSGLTIGRPQGAVWIGKPLDIVVPLSLDDAETGSGLCLEAEVVQGDLRIPDRSVTTSLEPGRSAASSRMRIRSTVTIDEPVVNVNVRAGCETRSTRSYVLLADVPTEASLPSVAMPAPGPRPRRRPRCAHRSARLRAGLGRAPLPVPRARHPHDATRLPRLPPQAPRMARRSRRAEAPRRRHADPPQPSPGPPQPQAPPRRARRLHQPRPPRHAPPRQADRVCSSSRWSQFRPQPQASRPRLG